MTIIKIIQILTGLILLIFSMGYLYHPDLVAKFNAWVRRHIFNDQLLISHRRKIGVLLLILGFIFIFTGIVG